MPISSLIYTLSAGYVQNWLVAGPLVHPVTSGEAAQADPASTIVQRHFEAGSGVAEPPVDLGPLGPVSTEQQGATWRYYRCRDDHFVDLTTAHSGWCYLRAWAYAQLHVPESLAVTLTLTAYGPADVWLNGQHLCRQAQLEHNRPRSVSILCTLEPSANELLVRFESAGIGEIPCMLAVRVEGLAAAEAQVRLPTNIETDLIEKRQSLEQLINQATLDQYVFGYLDGDHYERNEPIVVSFPASAEGEEKITFRLQSLAADIFQERTQVCQAGTRIELAKAFPLRNGPRHVALAPEIRDAYEKNMRFQRTDLFYVTRTAYAQTADPVSQPAGEAALDDAARRRNESLYCEIAKMALGRWEQVDWKIVNRVIERTRQGHPGSEADLLGLLGILLRFRKKQRYLRGIRPNVEALAAGYAYAADDLGLEQGPGGPACPPESRQILLDACEVLAGQLLPDRTFERSSHDGRWHQQHGEAESIAWLRLHGRYGFQAWDSPAVAEHVLAALAHLVDLADSAALRDLASVMLDKMMFSLAVNSFHGAYGSTKGYADTGSVLSARLEQTSGVARLMWGLGGYNEHVLGTVSLAACRRYELPTIIRQIAVAPADAVWSQERHARPADAAGAGDAVGEWEVKKVSYKTKDFMLSCAQDYRPGQPGAREHIWQATLAPDAPVFVNHPVSLSEEDRRQPNLWVGNGALPRAAQWGDVLVALYQLPADDWLNFTHAYFPAAAFDETVIQPRWAFARKGQGYVALMAAHGLQPVTTGPTAFRELRSYGSENVWLCHMGQALLDGSFEEFQHKILAMPVELDGLSLRLKTLRGDRLAFGWEGALLVNDQEQSLAGSRHIENPYCVADLPATQMDIVFQEQGLRLKFE